MKPASWDTAEIMKQKTPNPRYCRNQVHGRHAGQSVAQGRSGERWPNEESPRLYCALGGRRTRIAVQPEAVGVVEGKTLVDTTPVAIRCSLAGLESSFQSEFGITEFRVMISS